MPLFIHSASPWMYACIRQYKNVCPPSQTKTKHQKTQRKQGFVLFSALLLFVSTFGCQRSCTKNEKALVFSRSVCILNHPFFLVYSITAIKALAHTKRRETLPLPPLDQPAFLYDFFWQHSSKYWPRNVQGHHHTFDQYRIYPSFSSPSASGCTCATKSTRVHVVKSAQLGLCPTHRDVG